MSTEIVRKTIRETCGSGQVVFAKTDDGKTIATRAAAASPMRLLTPRNAGHAAWVYVSNFGGGLLAGDSLSLDVEVQSGATGYLSSQSSTKVYRSADESISRQTLEARIADGATLALLPDPVVCYADARYAQRQRFELAPTASLILLDWFTSGRHARGERWQAASFRSSNEIFINNRCLLRDILHVERPPAENITLNNRLGMRHFNCFATLILVGPPLAQHAAELLQQVAAHPVRRGETLPIGASPLPENAGAIFRAAGQNVEQVAHIIFQQLHFLEELLGECPWKRKW